MVTSLEIVDRELDARFDPQPFAGRRVTVVVPDATRPIDFESMVGPLLERLRACGAEVTVLVGLGLHRPMNDEEIAPLRRVADAHDAAVDQHDADADTLVELDADVSGGHAGWPTLPARFNRHVTGADRIVSVGTVEPHQYAGYSGGPKGVAIGCGSHETVSAMHGLEFLRHEGTRLGRTGGNRFHRALWELAAPAPPIAGLQIVPGVAGMPDSSPAAFFGPIDDAFGRATSLAETRFFHPVDAPYDWLHLPIPAEKAVNFYQASRAATYVALADRPALADDSTIIVEADCPEGLGTGAGERACAEAMRRGRHELLAELRSDDDIQTRGGQQRAYVVALARERTDIVLVGAPSIPELDLMDIPQYDTLETARQDLQLGARGTTIDDVFHCVPTLDT